MSLPRLSVVICTYNRAERLRLALGSIYAQALDQDQYEVVVVDNNSRDRTAGVIRDFAAHHDNLRACFEPEQGLSHARNCGWRAARGEYVLFLDDDAKVPPGWLGRALTLIDELAPAVVGGAYRAFYESPKPAWYRDEYGSHQLHDGLALITQLPDQLHGGNLLIRRTLLEQAGGFRPELGMRGELLGYGEETALLRAIRHLAPDAAMYFDPELWVFHLVAAPKMTLGWLLRHRFVSGRSDYRMDPAGLADLSASGLLGRVTLTLARLLLTTPAAMLVRDRKRYPFLMNWFYEEGSWRVFTLGKFYERCRASRS